jgi:ribosomal protein S18 acetylase RimI-like enzyme
MEDGIIRDYRAEDREPLVRLWHECGLVVSHNDPVRDIVYCISSGHGWIFVGCHEQAIVGSVMVGHDGHRGWLYYLAVAPSEQGTGWGRRIVDHAERFLGDQGIRKVQLMVRTSNEEVIEFYEGLGYERQPIVVLGKWLSNDV